jgi:hypothetical protein
MRAKLLEHRYEAYDDRGPAPRLLISKNKLFTLQDLLVSTGEIGVKSYKELGDLHTVCCGLRDSYGSSHCGRWRDYERTAIEKWMRDYNRMSFVSNRRMSQGWSYLCHQITVEGLLRHS